jgi:hypothetical protein
VPFAGGDAGGPEAMATQMRIKMIDPTHQPFEARSIAASNAWVGRRIAATLVGRIIVLQSR